MPWESWRHGLPLQVAAHEQRARDRAVADQQRLVQALVERAAGLGVVDRRHADQAEQVGAHHHRAGFADEPHRLGHRDAAVATLGAGDLQATGVGPALERRLADADGVGQFLGREQAFHGQVAGCGPRGAPLTDRTTG